MLLQNGSPELQRELYYTSRLRIPNSHVVINYNIVGA